MRVQTPVASSRRTFLGRTGPTIGALALSLIGGALAGMPTEYLRSLLKSGILRHVDKISCHPYRAVPETGYAETLRQWRDMIATFAESTGARNRKIELWQGENGCPS